MRIYLHIGAEKTGTSSIQRFFSRNRERLREQSILYSVAAGGENHMSLAAAAQNESKFDDLRMLYALTSAEKIREFRKELTERLIAEANAGQFGKMILSSEHCSSRLVSALEVERLAAMLWRITRDVTIVLYIRRQDEFLCSTYSTDVKSGFTGEMAIPNEIQRRARYDYYEMLRRWTSVFGRENLICRLYKQDDLRNGDVVDDFADMIGLELGDNYVRPPRVNESLNISALELLRLFNDSVPRFNDNALNPVRGNIVQVLQKVSTGPGPTLSPAALGEFMEYFHLSNRKVAREYFGQIAPSGDPLFGEAEQGKNKAVMQSIDVETAVRMAALLWIEKQEQINKMSQTIVALRERLNRFRNRPGGNAPKKFGNAERSEWNDD